MTICYELAQINFIFRDDLNVEEQWKLFQRDNYITNDICNISTQIEKTQQINDIYYYKLCANILLSKGALHLHSSFVLYRDKAILFTGPSGIGKTTQAELWRDYRGGLIVNGDASLIRKVDDVWQAFGTPIHGSSPYCENRQAPIAALIALRQGKENRMERLDGYEALRFCLPELYRPKMEPETEEVFWNTVDAFFSEIPVYLLTCRPDEDAVALTENTIFQTEN